MLSTLLLLSLLLVATATDIRRRRIDNRLTYSGTLLALMAGLVVTCLGEADMVHEPFGTLGFVPLSASVAGLVTCGFVMLVCYVAFPGGVGGGDVKLMTMMGAFLGVWEGLEAMLWTFVLGGCLALVLLVWRHGALNILRHLGQRLSVTIRARSWVPLTEQERQPLQVDLFLSPAALAAVLLVRSRLLGPP